MARDSHLRSGGVMLASLGGVQLLGLATGIIAARFLGPFDRGNLALAMLLPLIVSAIGDLGVERAATYYSATRTDRNQVASSLFALGIGQGVLAGVFAMFLCWLVFSIWASSILQFALLSCGIIPLSILSRYGQAQLQGQLRISTLALVRSMEPLLYLTLLTALVVTHHLTIGTAIGAKLLSQSGVIGWSWTAAVRPYGLVLPSQTTVMSILSYGVRGYVRQFSLTDTFAADQWVVGLWLGATQLAYYVVALSLVNVARVVPTAIATLVLPLYATNQLSAVRRLMMIGALLGLIVAVMLWVLSGPMILLLFGPNFARSIGPAHVLALGSAALVLKEILLAVVYGRGWPGRASFVELGSAFGLVVTLLVLAHLYGTSGVALSVVCSYIGGAAVATWVITRPNLKPEVVPHGR